MKSLKFLREPPDGILLTLPVQFFHDRQMSYAEFQTMFERYMRREDALWNFKLKNLPRIDVAFVYLVFDGFVQYRANLVLYERNAAKEFDDAPDGKIRSFPPSNWILFTGPIVKPVENIPMRGFQGFRYTAKLF